MLSKNKIFLTLAYIVIIFYATLNPLNINMLLLVLYGALMFFAGVYDDKI